MFRFLNPTFALTIFFIISNSANSSVSLTIEGPELTGNLTGFGNAGLQLTTSELENVTIVGFTFQNQGKSDTIQLKNSVGDVLQTYNYAGGDVSHIASVNWILEVQQSYFLTSQKQSNGKIASFSSFPSNNEHIQVDGSFAIGSLNTRNWFNFNDIITTITPPQPPVETPVPAAIWFFATGLITLWGSRKIRF